MARFALLDVTRGFPMSFVLLALCAGCSGASPPSETNATTGTVASDLSLPFGVCGGREAKECGGERVCASILANGCSNEHMGICVDRPKHCPSNVAKVCGCDGVTYGNFCEAVQGGTSIDHYGACATAPACGENGASCPGSGTCSVQDHHGMPFPFFFGGLSRDRGGVCECKAAKTCGAGQTWNDDPAVCACVGNTDPCAGVTCKAGEVCVAQSGVGMCETDPCTSVTCKTGDVCVAQSDGSATCETDPCSSVTCKAGQACVVSSGGTASCE